MKKTISLLLSAAMLLTGAVNIVSAAETSYKQVDLSAYANCIGFTAELSADKEYKVPDYIGTYTNAKNDKDMKGTWILNKTAFDEKKDDDGLITAKDGIPFKVSTSETAKNVVLLSKKTSTGDVISGLAEDGSVEIYVDSGKYKSASILADITGTRTCDVVFNYGDTTKLEKEIKFVKHNTAEELGKNADITSYVEFDYTAPTEDDADAGKKSALLLKDSGVVAESQNVPVYKVTLDEEKELTSIKITNSSNSYGLAILGITLEAASEVEILNKKIDELPSFDEVTFGNYKTYKSAIEEVKAMLDRGVTTDEVRTKKAEDLYVLLTKLDTDPAEEIKYLIDQLPEADTINSTNYKGYISKIDEIEEKLTADIVIDSDRMTKYQSVSEAIMTESNKAELANLIKQLPKASEVTEDNCAGCEEILNKIQVLLDKGIAADDESLAKIEEIKAAVTEAKSTYNPYVCMDYSPSYNAKLYGTSDMTTADSSLRTPYYLGVKTSDETMYYPTMILNKKLFEEKSKNGIIYSENKKIPLAVDTNGGVMLGSNGGPNGEKNTLKKEIPVTQGNYESVSIMTVATYQFEVSQFKFEVKYTDGTSVVDPDWLLPEYGSTKEQLMAKDAVDDVVFFELDTSNADKQLQSSPWFSRVQSGNIYTYTSPRKVSTALPVITLKCDPNKTVKSIEITANDTWRAMAVLAITAKLPTQEELKGVIESKIKTIDKTNLAAESDNIYAIINMLKAYEGKTGAEEISGLADFEAIKDTFEKSITEVSNVETKTDFDYIKTTVKFRNAVDMSKMSEYITLTLKGSAFEDYTLDTTDSKQVIIKIKNDFDYDKSFKVTLSSKIQSSVDASFKLGSDYTYEFTPTAPVSVEKFNLYDKNGKAIESLEGQTGSKVRFEFEIKNNTVVPNQKCAVSVCVHDENDKLVKVYLIQKNLSKGESAVMSESFTLPNDGEYKITSCVLDGFTTMNKLTASISK